MGILSGVMMRPESVTQSENSVHLMLLSTDRLSTLMSPSQHRVSVANSVWLLDAKPASPSFNVVNSATSKISSPKNSSSQMNESPPSSSSSIVESCTEKEIEGDVFHHRLDEV